MGAVSFMHTIEATSAEKAKQMLVGDALYEHGHDGYNGTISTCYGRCRCIKSFDKYSQKNEKEMLKYAETRFEHLDKREMEIIDLGIIGYNRITVKKTTFTPSAKYEQRYAVVDACTGNTVSPKAYRKTKTEAHNLAIKYLLEGKCVEVRKMPVLISGNNLCTAFEMITERTNKMPNASKYIVEPVHKYIVYGWAAE